MKALLVVLGSISSLLTFVYSVCLPLALALSPQFDAFALIEFISIGFKHRCGLTIAILGFPSLIILLSHLVAILMSAQQSNSRLWLCFGLWFAEYAGWFVVLGYECTDFYTHNVGLFGFLVGGFGIHYLFCTSFSDFYALDFYKKVNASVLIMALGFGVVSLISTLACCDHREIQNAALFVEFFLMLLVTIQQLCFFYVLQLMNFDVVFEFL